MSKTQKVVKVVIECLWVAMVAAVVSGLAGLVLR